MDCEAEGCDAVHLLPHMDPLHWLFQETEGLHYSKQETVYQGELEGVGWGRIAYTSI
jgi:hypothetical protein